MLVSTLVRGAGWECLARREQSINEPQKRKKVLFI